MFSPEEYRLIDFGNGRRLEQFGPLVLDRPCEAAADAERADPAAWSRADDRFVRNDRKKGSWVAGRELPDRWTIRHGAITFELKRTEFGHLGLFPEQATNWDWLAERLKGRSQPAAVLNLFAYTGGSTLAAAAVGAEVVHVDAAKNVIRWARRNAELSGLGAAPVRWIADDARKFVRREVRRGSRYDAVILDPPSYGHGSRGEVWRLSRHLRPLLTMCANLLEARHGFLLLTCHTPAFGPKRLAGLVSDTLASGRVSAEPLVLRPAAPRTHPTGPPNLAGSRRELPSGVVVRWEADS